MMRSAAFQRVVGAEDGRRLAAQFQRHRRQVVRRHAHDVVADLGRAGEQQVVEGQPREIGAHRGVAQHHRDILGGESISPPARPAARRCAA
jgi:hypothetical protein